MGAFKFRGAYNALVQLDAAQRERGVLAFSSGNHAQAIALSARLLDMPAVIVMPEDAPASKMAATREYGAQVVTYDRFREDREAISRRLAEERGMVLVPPFDHPHVIAGQGTAAVELLEDVPGLDYLFVCLGGGGLLSGCLLAAEQLAPDCKVVGVEPEAGNDVQQSLRAGHIMRIETPRTIADGAQTQAPGEITFPIIQRLAHEIVTVADAQARPGAAVLRRAHEDGGRAHRGAGAGRRAPRRHRPAGARVGIVVSGGNVDLPRYARFLAD